MLPMACLALVLSAPVPDLEGFVAREARVLVEREGVPGLSIAVLLDGELVFARGFGWADERLGLPVEKNTAFPIGSLGRSFCAALALIEVERGSLALDARVEQLLPTLPAALKPITLLQLLDGSSGLPGTSELFERLAARASEGALTRAEFLEVLGTLAPRRAPGEAFDADTSSWRLLPLIVSDAARRPYAEALSLRVLEPLGLRDTRVCDEVPGLLGHAADCREVARGRDLEVWSGAEPSEARASLCSTPADLVRWMAAVSDRALLSERSTRLLTETARSADGQPLGRNACFELAELAGQPRWRHEGGAGGWRGALAWYPSAHLGVCVLANCSAARVGALEEELARFVLQLPPRELADLPLEREELAAFPGGYQLGTTRVRIALRDGRLWYESAAEEPFRLRSQGFGRFVSADGETWIVFQAADGRAESFRETRKGATSVARRMD